MAECGEHARQVRGQSTNRQPKNERAEDESIPVVPPRSRASRPRAERTFPRIRWWLVCTIALVVLIAVTLLEAPMFEARSVQLSGNARTNEGLIHEALSIPEDQALLLYDFGAAELAVSALPWVKDVEVTRQWPSTVRVVISERGVVAAIGRPDGSEWVVISDDGVVVENRATPPANVPLIIATNNLVNTATVGERVPAAERALEVALNVPGQLDAWITTWTLDENLDLTAELVGSAEVSFGAFEDQRTQFVSLASILNGGAELTCLDRIDLSVADTPVLDRNAACIVEAAQLN